MPQALTLYAHARLPTITFQAMVCRLCHFHKGRREMVNSKAALLPKRDFHALTGLSIRATRVYCPLTTPSPTGKVTLP